MSDPGACPTCGARVTVVTGGEGTSHYQPQGDRVDVLRHWQCDGCGQQFRDQPLTLSHAKLNAPGLRCHGPVVAVEYVPRSQLTGAVEALRAIHHEAEYLVEGARIGEGSRLVGERIVKLAAPHIGGQSSPAGCPACSPDPKTARPPHTCSGEQS